MIGKNEPNISSRRKTAWLKKNGGFRHPLLQLMPFARGCNSELLELERFIFAAVLPGIEDHRIKAVLSLESLISNWRHADAANGLFEEVLDLVRQQVVSAQLNDLKTKIVLESFDLEVAEVQDSCACAAYLLCKKIPLSYAREAPKSAITFWASTIRWLESKSPKQLATLSLDERLASIRILWLFVQYRGRLDRPANLQAAREFLERTGISLHRALFAGAVKEQTNDFTARNWRFGFEALEQVRHRINDGSVADKPRFVMIQTGQDDGKFDKTSAMEDWNNPKVIIVPKPIPAGADAQERELLTRYERLRLPLPLALLPDAEELDEMCLTLQQEFPWASNTIIDIFNNFRTCRLTGSNRVNMAPALLLGRPGVGKTRLVRRIAELLKLPFLTISIGGTDDARSIMGTARGWGSAQPSSILSLLLANQSANAIILLDEIDKGGGRTKNSVPITSALLGLLELETAKRWLDPFLQVECDLSHVIYFATANSYYDIPGAMRSRLNVRLIEQPTTDQLLQSISSVIADIEKEWVLPAGVLPRILPQEIPVKCKNMREVKAVVRVIISKWAENNLGRRRLH